MIGDRHTPLIGVFIDQWLFNWFASFFLHPVFHQPAQKLSEALKPIIARSNMRGRLFYFFKRGF
jgi:hypothetical protein